MTVQIYDHRHRNLREFADFPSDLDVAHEPGEVLCGHLAALTGLEVTNYKADAISAYIDFTYRRHDFVAALHHPTWSLAVKQPDCSEDILREVAEHCARYLEGR